jgi:hypothetical protein
MLHFLLRDRTRAFSRLGLICFILLLAFWVAPWHIWGQGILHFNTLTWTLSTTPGVTVQKVYRGTVSGGPYTLLATINNGTATTYQDTAVTLGQKHCYVLTATAGSESVFGTEACVTDAGTNVNPQTGLAVTSQ